MATLITSGIDYARFFDDLRAVIRQEVQALGSAHNPAPRVGGIELGQEISGLSKARVYQLVHERSIPHSKRGNRLYFNEADLRAWVAEGKRSTAVAQ